MPARLATAKSQQKAAKKSPVKQQRSNFLPLDRCQEICIERKKELDSLKNSTAWETIDAKERRRLRNVQLALRTRLRNKKSSLNLQQQLQQLSAENAQLRESLDLEPRLPVFAAADLLQLECSLPADIKSAVASLFPISDEGTVEVCGCYCILSTLSPRLPIVFASDDLLQLTDYDRSELIGQDFGLLLNTAVTTANATAAAVVNSISQQQQQHQLLLQQLQKGDDISAKSHDSLLLLLQLQRKNGDLLPARGTFQHLRDAAQRSFFVVARFEDLRSRDRSATAVHATTICASHSAASFIDTLTLSATVSAFGKPCDEVPDSFSPHVELNRFPSFEVNPDRGHLTMERHLLLKTSYTPQQQQQQLHLQLQEQRYLGNCPTFEDDFAIITDMW